MKAPLTMTKHRDKGGAAMAERAVMQDDRVHWNGQSIAVVLAETQEQADHAATLIAVAYAAEPASLDFQAAKAEAKPPENILGEPAAITVGDAEAALAAGRSGWTRPTPPRATTTAPSS